MNACASSPPTQARSVRPNGAPPIVIGPNAVILGYVLKSIPNSDFGMGTFNGRLRLQKLIYMVEAFGVYLGYDFSWYLRGPYCTSLARTGFELEQIIDRIPDDTKARFLQKDIQKKFDRCLEFIRSIMGGSDDLDKLEIASSIHILAKTTNASKKDIFEHVVSKIPGNADRRSELLALCEKMWNALSGLSVLPDAEKRLPNSAERSSSSSAARYTIKTVPESIDPIKDAMIEKQQYGDAAIAVTLKDLHEHNQDLEPNDQPAFAQRPSHVAQLASDSKRNEILEFVTRQYR